MREINLKDCVVTIKGGSTGNHIDIVFGDGNLTYDEKITREYKRDRGLLDTVRNGDEEPMDVKFEGRWSFITGDSDITIEDALKKAGDAASWTSSDADACNPYAVDIIIKYTPPCTGEVPETITLPDFRYEQLSHDLKAATISVTGKCNATKATAVRGAIAS